ncbi:tyrosine-type recombinase/integrase [Aneurinibacillus aneurinilyticus]|uniref:Site-specific integrase n=1 Tax=Aneurinibacillus aneurinilyticus TaxID=1391 RepID=A0A848D1F6_ANEAE|nr:site-specific integrase [Aneurinibacillus aneurinilyticus]NMF01279.1 site-specific integrase [Aneurinibacillus aneurinilyticus]
MKGTVEKEGNSWFYVVDLGKDEYGKRKRKKKRGFKTKKEAQQALTKLLHEVNTGAYVEPSNMKYESYLHEWLEGKKHVISKQTYILYCNFMKVHVVSQLGHIQLNKLSPLHIQKFIANLKNKGLADGTVRRIFTMINVSLNAAEKMQIIPKNPASLIEKPKEGKSNITVWDVPEINKFLQVAESKGNYYPAFFLAIMSGMRQGEILGLSWKDVDLNNGIIYITQILSHDGSEIFTRAKTKQSIRSVSISPNTVDFLRTLKQQQGLNDMVVQSSKGTPVSPSNLIKEMKRIIKLAGVPPIRFHDLRHTHAILMLKNGEHVKVVSERLGHSKIQMTLDTYSHVLPNMQADAAKRTLVSIKRKALTVQGLFQNKKQHPIKIISLLLPGPRRM